MNNIDEVILDQFQEDTRPVHLYFTTGVPLGADTPMYRVVAPNLPRRLLWVTNWAKLAEMMKLSPASICISADYFKDRSFIEVISMFETFTSMLSTNSKSTITLGVKKDTPYSLIKEAQRSNILGIIPSSQEFNIDETMRGIQAQFANIPYWPKHILDALPGAKKLPEKPQAISLTGRQQQIFDIIISRGCSNKHIAKIMGISESTVKLHLSNIFKKYGVKNRTQLAVFSKTSIEVLDKV